MPLLKAVEAEVINVIEHTRNRPRDKLCAFRKNAQWPNSCEVA